MGDWERITIRTVNGVASSIDYHAHDDKGSGTLPYAQAPKFSPSSPSNNPDPNNSDSEARPVAYVAQGSHGMWSSAGTFTYIDAVVLKLQDATSDNGVYWDTQNNLVTINYPDTYTDSLAWLNYKGSWGNKGTTNCWWYFIYKECELSSGPNGPLRDDVEGSRAKTVQGSRASSSLFDKANMKGTLSVSTSLSVDAVLSDCHVSKHSPLSRLVIRGTLYASRCLMSPLLALALAISPSNNSAQRVTLTHRMPTRRPTSLLRSSKAPQSTPSTSRHARTGLMFRDTTLARARLTWTSRRARMT